MGATKLLGDLRAENDAKMLSVAFYETADYRALTESPDRAVVVGRRGTGKSALVFRLESYWRAEGRAVISIGSEADQVPSLLEILSKFGPNPRTIRAASRMLWEHAILLEVAYSLSTHYRFKKAPEAESIRKIASQWHASGSTFFRRLRLSAERARGERSSIASVVAELSDALQLPDLRASVARTADATRLSTIVLIDRLDEGFDLEAIAIDVLMGLIYTAVEMPQHQKLVHPTLFIRDNMFRAVSRRDDDYTRNLEGNVLRLHWSERELLEMAASRIRVAFELGDLKPEWTWNRIVANELKGMDGFRHSLRLTLYRPRDLVSLLNESLVVASRLGRTTLVPSDLDNAARDISRARLDDLRKEYDSIVPGVRELTAAFAGNNPVRSVSGASDVATAVIGRDEYSTSVQQSFEIYESPEEVLRALYGIGFLGIKEEGTGLFAFCHDGREPSLELRPQAQTMIHPCYWRALELSVGSGEEVDTSEVYDDYEISVSATSVDQRRERLGKLIARCGKIQAGEDDASEFESWCLDAVRIVFSGGLRNVELKPSRDTTSRRDIVGRNDGETSFWKRVRDDHHARQVVFEVKNYDEPQQSDYRQLMSYLGDMYGDVGFLIYHSDRHLLRGTNDLHWMKDLYHSNGKLIVRLSSKYLCDLLSKLRSPERFGYPDDAMGKLLDTHQRNYLGEQISSRRKRR